MSGGVSCLSFGSGWASRISEENQKYITCTAHDLKTPLTVFKLATTVFQVNLLP